MAQASSPRLEGSLLYVGLELLELYGVSAAKDGRQMPKRAKRDRMTDKVRY